MTNKKQNKVVETSKSTKRQASRVNTKEVVAQKSYRVPKCSVNFVVIEKFEDEMKTLKLSRETKVNDIMLALYAKHGTNLNPNVLANQIAKFKNVDKTPEDKDFCKISPNCVSWYKNHYNAELHKFVSTKKKGLTKEQIIEKLYSIEVIKNSPVADFIPALSLTKLKEMAEKYELV